jgi:SprT protein
MDPGAELAAAVTERLDGLLARTEAPLRRHRAPPLPRPTVVFFDHRLDAGRAVPPARVGDPGVLEVNAVYLRRHPEAMLRETLAHELAHLVVFHLRPRRRTPPHGALWQRIMREWFGVEPERTHRFGTEGVRARRQRRWRYRCGCTEHVLTTVRHNRVRAGQRYLCRRCRGALEYLAPHGPAEAP